MIRKTLQVWLFSSALLCTQCLAADPAARLETFTLKSARLANTLIGVDPNRTIRVWLPPDYHQSDRRYPVVYFIHNINWDNERTFSINRADQVIDRGFAASSSSGFITVVGDFTTPQIGTFFGNNDVSGRWFDHIVDELVPAIDARYRTIAAPSSRGVTGDNLGGYAALKLPMLKPGVFSAVYALHPVGTGTGSRLMNGVADWQQMNDAEDWDDLSGYSVPFMLMAQAHSANPDKPPFYADLMIENLDGELVLNVDHSKRLRRNFLLSKLVPEHVEELRQLTAYMFDWGRYDDNRDHVEANQKFTRVLDEYGIEHEAEEYRGGAWDKLWVQGGRVERRMVPFFLEHLATEPGVQR